MNKIYTLTLASLLAAGLSTSVGAEPPPPPPPPPPPGSSGPVVASAGSCGVPLIKKRAEKLEREGLLPLGEGAEIRKLVIGYLAGTLDDEALADYKAKAEEERQARAAASAKARGKSMLGGSGQDELAAALARKRAKASASESSEE